MGMLTFSIDERLRTIVAHAAASKKHRAAYGQRRPKPALWLVHDAGVYLMSNGDPLQLDPQKQHGTARVAQHAHGCGPDNAGWERSRELVGGDDFVEPLDLAFFEKAIADGKTKLALHVSESRIRMEAS